MNSTDILVKTTAGGEELKSRARKLPQRARTLLIMIDGTLNAAQLQDAAAKLGIPGDALSNLLTQGLISIVPAASSGVARAAAQARTPSVTAAVLDVRNESERFNDAQKFMNDTAVDALGLRSFFFTLKLEKCFTRADLAGLLPDYVKAITKGSGANAAAVLATQARTKLG